MFEIHLQLKNDMDKTMSDDLINELIKTIDKLKQKINLLEQKRIYQQDIVPDGVKQRHMGEGNRYIWAGLEADLPDGASVTSSVVAYFCTDTFKLKIWTGDTYKSVTLS